LVYRASQKEKGGGECLVFRASQLGWRAWQAFKASQLGWIAGLAFRASHSRGAGLAFMVS
jgi:hypothetical protein